MPSTANKGYEIQTTGTNEDTWGDVLNNDMIARVDLNLGGLVTKTLSNVQVDLSAAESRNLIVRLIGTLTGNVLVTTAAIGMTIVENLTSGAFAVTFKNASVAGTVTIPQNTRAVVITDATNGARTAADNQTEFASGMKLFTSQAAAPTGWTIVATNANRAIRISGTAGGGTGGSASFTDIFTTRGITGSVGGTAITIAQMPAHTHDTNPLGNNDNDNSAPPCASNSGVIGATFNTTSAGGGQAHDHSLTINNLNMNLQYLDVIEIQKT